MRFKIQTRPFVRSQASVPSLTLNFLIALLPLVVMSVYYYGIRALVVTGISAGTCYALDMLCMFITTKRIVPEDLSSIVTGVVMAMLMPASVNYSVPVIGAFIAIVIAKWPFGGFGQNPFNPAAVGFAFLSLTYSKSMFLYPLPFTDLPLSGTVQVPLVESASAMLKMEGIPGFGKMEMLLGKFPGPMGATNILVIATCLLLLLALRSVTWHVPVTMVATMGAYAFLFPRVASSRLGSMFYELIAGGIVFIAVFMASDTVTAPKTKPAKLLYAVLTGVATMVFGRYGAFEVGACFAIILMNSICPLMDRLYAYYYYHRAQLKEQSASAVRRYGDRMEEIFKSIGEFASNASKKKQNSETTSEVDSNDQD